MLLMTEKYLTGIRRIDIQHQKLFVFINTLEEEIENDATAKNVQNALNFMEEYIFEHFSDEEGSMKGYNCPVAEENIKAHEGFIREWKRFDIRWSAGEDNKAILQKMHRYVESWLTEHILTIDCRLKDCLERSGARITDFDK